MPVNVNAAVPLGFIDDQPVRNDLVGALQGTVKFAQTHTIDAANNAVNELPTLVSERDALVMFIPQTAIAESEMGKVKVTALRGNTVLGERVLAPPRLFPASDRSARDSRPDVEYSLKAWSAQLPWDWMKPGLSLRFSHVQRTGFLSEQSLEMSGPGELVLQSLRIGLLTDPVRESSSWLETHAGLGIIDYFQKIPVARLTVGQYLPIRMSKVVLPNGTVYTNASSGTGSVYSGDLRDFSRTIAGGIHRANFGMIDSAGSDWITPGFYHQAVLLQAAGNYANGVVRHGLHAGPGVASLLETTGNEFSRAMGYVYELRDFPGGGRWSSHHAGSGWGYDAFRNRMLGNLRWSAATGNNTVEGVVTPPFKGLYRYRSDPMAGGEPDGTLSRLTHHTGYTAKRIQERMVGFSQLDASSPTGHSYWDAVTKTVVPTPDRVRPTQFGVPVVTLMGLYDPDGVFPTTLFQPMYGSFGQIYEIPRARAAEMCHLTVQILGGRQIDIPLKASRHSASEMNKFHVNVPTSSRPEHASVSCVIAGQQRKLAELTYERPPTSLPQTITVGKGDGYAQAGLRLPIIQASVTGFFESVDALEQRLQDIYGEIHDWSYSKSGLAGSLYVYSNPFTGFREYFMLKKPRYDYFPTAGNSNDFWRYMGRAEDHVNWSPEPIRVSATPGSSLEQKLMSYYKVSRIKNWMPNDTTVRQGDIYQYQNPYSKRQEFLMARSSSYGAFPTNARANNDWIYLGSHATLSVAFTPVKGADFERRLRAWHHQDSMHSWGVPNNTGVVGEIYRYPWQGRVDYFRLKTRTYSYFPTDRTSNSDWEYLGTMP